MRPLKFYHFAYLSLFIAFCLTACGKKGNAPTPSEQESSIQSVTWPSNADIYFVGFISTKEINQAPTVWKNGESSTLVNTLNGTPAIEGKAMAVAVANNKVYVAGSALYKQGTVAVYWENGVIKKLSDKISRSEGNAIAVSGNDIYVAGESDIRPTLWKNGVEITLTDMPGLATAVFVNGVDVYVAGNTYENGWRAILWKNGKVVPFDTDGLGYGSFVNALWVSGDDVYLAGFVDGKGAMICKNGKLTLISPGEYAVATDIVVKGSDVYASGYVGSQTVLWKNGNGTPMPFNDRNSTRNKISVGLNGNDVYLSSGFENTTNSVASILWLNNAAYKFSKDASVINGMAIVPR